MEPEEIDKLFKDRLAGLPAMPSADAWDRLRQKMEPPKKEKTIWMFYVAASISLLLVAGIFFFQKKAPGIPGSEIAIQKPAFKNSKENAPGQATEKITSASSTKSQKKKPDISLVKKDTGKDKDLALSQKPVLVASAVKSKKEKSVREKPKNANFNQVNEVSPVALHTAKPAIPEKSSLTPPDNAPEGPIEIVYVLVKRDNLEELSTETEEGNLRGNLARKGVLLKNVYKQARNLKNGEPVELATLGIDTEKIRSESKLIKEKFNKVISL